MCQELSQKLSGVGQELSEVVKNCRSLDTNELVIKLSIYHKSGVKEHKVGERMNYQIMELYKGKVYNYMMRCNQVEASK